MAGLSPDQRDGLAEALARGIAYRDSLSGRSPANRLSVAEALERFRGPLPETGTALAPLVAEIAEAADDGLLQITSPRFFAYVAGASHPAGVAGDILTSFWGQNAAYAATTPAVAAIERTVCDWTLEILDLPRDAGVGIVTGASVANTSGVLAARNALLKRANWDVEADGLFGAPPITVIAGEDAHSSSWAALRYAGLGSARVRRVRSDRNGLVDPGDYAEAIAAASGPILVILQAGHVNSGGFDAFAELIPMAHEKSAWVHVDGAFGLWMRAVPELRVRLAGVEMADSWALDLHKWLNAPFDAALVITRDPEPLTAALSAEGSYLPDAHGGVDFSATAPELSRRARGVPSYAIYRHLGARGIREMVARHCRLAERIGQRLAAEPGLSVLNEVRGNQVAVACGAGPAGDDQTREVLARVQARGRVYPSHATWHGRAIIRISIVGHETAEEDADALVDEIVTAWREVQRAAAAAKA